MIKIEIISVQPQSITVALYYPVPDAVYSLASKDDNRTPAGTWGGTTKQVHIWAYL